MHSKFCRKCALFFHTVVRKCYPWSMIFTTYIILLCCYQNTIKPHDCTATLTTWSPMHAIGLGTFRPTHWCDKMFKNQQTCTCIYKVMYPTAFPNKTWIENKNNFSAGAFVINEFVKNRRILLSCQWSMMVCHNVELVFFCFCATRMHLSLAFLQ